jgi:hypothetical protein
VKPEGDVARCQRGGGRRHLGRPKVLFSRRAKHGAGLDARLEIPDGVRPEFLRATGGEGVTRGHERDQLVPVNRQPVPAAGAPVLKPPLYQTKDNPASCSSPCHQGGKHLTMKYTPILKNTTGGGVGSDC